MNLKLCLNITSLFLLFFCLSSSSLFANNDLNPLKISNHKNCPEIVKNLDISYLEVQNNQDYYYCFGYLHGRDRAWQMDFFRRTAQGRNAEVLGYKHIKSDLMMRLLDLPSLAHKLWTNLSPEERQPWIDYSLGVNQGFQIGQLAQEFISAQYKPEPWQAFDSISVLLLQSFDQTRKSFLKDYDEEKGVEKYGDKSLELFSHDNLPWEDTILHEGEYPKKISEKKEEKYSYQTSHLSTPSLWSSFPTLFGIEAGSNNWVVSKNKSQNKVAMLANDPHLNLKTPLFWYWLSIKINNGLQTIGASLPGVPIIISGTNGKLAWGLTNAYINTADAMYITDIPHESLDSLRPVVWFKWGILKLPFFFKSFSKIASRFPLLPLETNADLPLALRWSGFWLEAKDLAPMLQLKNMQNVEEMNELLKHANFPAWNFVFADHKGHIGYRVVGKAFKHEQETKIGISKISYQDFKNPNFLQPDERPSLVKPERHFIYTANHRHWPKDAHYNGGRAYSMSFRGLKIHKMLKETKLHTLQSFKAIQCDREASDAQFFAPLLINVLENFSKNQTTDNELRHLVQKTISLFKNWNYQATKDCRACGIYRRWIDRLKKEWLVEEPGLYRLLQESLLLTISKPEFNLRGHILSTLKESWNDIGDRTWGELHLNPFRHLAMQEFENSKAYIFAPEISTEGDDHSIDPGTAKWNDERKVYEHYSGSSMRMIIELSTTKPEIWLSLPGKNKSYDNLEQDQIRIKNLIDPWHKWSECEYEKIEF